MKPFQPNINSRGRALRAFGALIFALGAAATWSHSRIGSAVFAGIAIFMFFEAGRGWCAARACGIKTPL